MPPDGGIMYVFDDMIDMGLIEGKSWPSPAHRKVAQNVLLRNPMVTSRTLLQEYVDIICNLTEEAINEVTVNDLRSLDIPIPY
jgi:hypothetical protein